MSLREGWQRWVHNPQSALWRHALLKLHLWTGMTLALYLVLICVTGAVAVFRRDLGQWLMPRNHAGLAPLPVALMEWTVDLHDNLLAGETGRMINGIGAIAFTLLILTGAVLWWPGRSRWLRSLFVPWPTRTRRFTWHLHTVLGFWGFFLLAGWAVTGIYFAFPDLFNAMFDAFDDNLDDFDRPGEGVLQWFIRMHFGRFGPLGMHIVMAVAGLLPIVLFITGFIVWWQRRRISKAARRLRAGPAAAAPAPVLRAEGDA